MIGLDSAQNIRFIQLRAFLFVTRLGGYVSLTLECQMFLPPSMITISIAATRIYRLADQPPVGPVRFRRNGKYDITTPIPFFSALNVVYIAGLATPSAPREVVIA